MRNGNIWLSVVLILGVAGARAAQPDGQAATYLPDTVLGAVTLRDGAGQVRAFRKTLAAQRFTESPTYRALTRNPQFMAARVGLAGFTAAAGVPAWTGLGAVLGQELTIGLVPGDDDEPRFIVVSVLKDPATVDRLLGAIHVIAGLDRDGEPNPEKSQRIGDVVVYSANPNLHHCRIDDALIVANDRALLRAAIAARRDKKNRLADAKAYQEAARRVPADAVAWAYADIARIRQLVTGGEPYPTKLPNALASFLFGSWWHTIAHADRALLWATTDTNQLRIDGQVETTEPLPDTFRGFVPKPVPADTWSAADLPRYLAEISITRDWAELFSEREAVMTVNAASDLGGFTGVVTTLMGNMDFVDEFLPNVAGPLRLILTRQDFSKKAYSPTPKIPAFALVIPLRDDPAKLLGRRLNTVSIQVLAFLNLNAGQEGAPTFLIDLLNYRGHTMIATDYANPPASGRMKMKAPGARPARDDKPAPTLDAKDDEAARAASLRYNFAPAGAVVGNRYILASSGDLLRDIIDLISRQTGRSQTSDEVVDRVGINGREVAAILADNRQELVTNRMLDTDRPKATVEREIDGLLGLLGFTDRLELVSRSTGKRSHATITLTLRDTPAPRSESN